MFNLPLSKKTLGLVVVGVIIFVAGFFLAQKLLLPEIKIPPPSTATKPLILDVLEPEDEIIVNETFITVSGRTKPEATVAIVGGVDDIILEPQPDGNFSTQIALVEGENELTIIANDESGNEKVEQRTIVYTTEELE